MTDDLLALALEEGGMGAWDIDLRALAMQLSPAAADMVGRSTGQTSVAGFERGLYPDDRPLFHDALARAMRGQRFECEVRVRRKDGLVTPLRMVGRVDLDDAGRPQRVQGVVKPGGAQLSPDNYQRDGRSAWSMLFDLHSVGMAQVDPVSARLLRINDSFAHMLGQPKVELVGRRLTSLARIEQRAATWGGLRSLLRSEAATFECEQELLTAGGQRIWVQLVVNLLREPGGAPLMFIVIVIDISRRRHLEALAEETAATLAAQRTGIEERMARQTADLARVNAALLEEIGDRKRAEGVGRDVLSGMVEAIEEERRRISRELHDTLGQHLAVLSIGIKSLSEELVPAEVTQSRLDNVQAALAQIEHEVDRLAHELRPSALDDFGLEEAVRLHAETWSQQSGVATEVITHGFTQERLAPVLETTTYRVIQEALTNVQRHARANRVSIICERRAGELRVVVEDDGCGFDPQRARDSGRLGLRGMSERSALVAGALEVESMPGRGTTVYLTVPLA